MDVLVRHGGSQRVRYCVLRERGVVDDGAFVVMHTRLVPLGSRKRASIRCLFGFPDLPLLISLLAFQVLKGVFLVPLSRSLFVCSLLLQVGE